MQWDQALEQSLSWNELWGTDQGKLTFLLHAVADLLPTPNNLKDLGQRRRSIQHAVWRNSLHSEAHLDWMPQSTRRRPLQMAT